LAFLFGEGFQVQLDRFTDVGDGLVERPRLRVATFQLRASRVKAMFVFFDTIGYSSGWS